MSLEALAVLDMERDEVLRIRQEWKDARTKVQGVPFVTVEVIKLREYLTPTGYKTPSGAWVPPMTRSDWTTLADPS